MLTEVKNQFKVTLLSIKYSLMREMLNKAAFISNIVFMMLNNACFIIQWVILFSIKDNIGGCDLKDIFLIWGLAASTYGVAHFFFNNAFDLSECINTGVLDTYIVQPKNVLISAITSKISVSAIGDFIYGYIMLILYGITFKNFILFTLFSITGGIVMAMFAVILGSLSFWFSKTDTLVEVGNNLVTNFATYPEGIFKGIVKYVLYFIVPVGIINFIPLTIIMKFSLMNFIIILMVIILIIILAFIIFYQGLKRYSSTNLMNVRI